jgi:hypothetical protein
MGRNARRTRSPYEKLEIATGTLDKERKFFEALIAADPVALVVNRIIHLVTFFQGAERFIPPYLESHGTRLFPTDSMEVTAILHRLLCDIAGSARLAGYLCVKGIPEQALTVLRGAVEQIGVYAQVWHDPSKWQFVPDSDSEEYRKAFRSTDDRLLNKELKAKGVKFRFMHCTGAQAVSKCYALLSAYFVHGCSTARKGERQSALSCEFVDRGAPMDVAPQFEMVQSIMSLIFIELLSCIPHEDLMEEELAPLSIVFGVLFPVVASASNEPDVELQKASDKLLDALRSVEIGRPAN